MVLTMAKRPARASCGDDLPHLMTDSSPHGQVKEKNQHVR